MQYKDAALQVYKIWSAESGISTRRFNLVLPHSCKCVWRLARLVRAVSDSSLNVMDSTPLPCDVHAHLMLKWPIHGTIVFQSCQGKVQNRAHFLLPGVITMPQFTAQSIHRACTEMFFSPLALLFTLKIPNLILFGMHLH